MIKKKKNLYENTTNTRRFLFSFYLISLTATQKAHTEGINTKRGMSLEICGKKEKTIWCDSNKYIRVTARYPANARVVKPTLLTACSIGSVCE